MRKVSPCPNVIMCCSHAWHILPIPLEVGRGIMMTSSNGNIFYVTGLLCGEFTGPGEFPTQRPVARSFDVFFDLRLNKRLSKQPWGCWFETLSWSLWRHCNVSAEKCEFNDGCPPDGCPPLVLGWYSNYYNIHTMYYSFVLSNWNKVFLRDIYAWIFGMTMTILSFQMYVSIV